MEKKKRKDNNRRFCVVRVRAQKNIDGAEKVSRFDLYGVNKELIQIDARN
jgi:hypothetical protein